MKSSSECSFLLSVISFKWSLDEFRLVPKVEAWLATWDCEVLAQRREAQVAIARVTVSSGRVDEFLLDFQKKKPTWLDSSGCDVNLCPLSICKGIQENPAKFLFVFDMDSTLIDMECIDELAELSGNGAQVAVFIFHDCPIYA